MTLSLRRVAVLMLWSVVLVAGVRGLWIATAGPDPGERAWDDRTAAQLDFLTFGGASAMYPLIEVLHLLWVIVGVHDAFP